MNIKFENQVGIIRYCSGRSAIDLSSPKTDLHWFELY